MRIAYRDEFPWARCECGWTVHNADDHKCFGCGRVESPVRKDRFSLDKGQVTTDVIGYEYFVVPYEDKLRKSY